MYTRSFSEQEAEAQARAAAKQRSDEKAEKDSQARARRKAAEEKAWAEAEEQKRIAQVLADNAAFSCFACPCSEYRTSVLPIFTFAGLHEPFAKQEATAQRLADAKCIADARSAQLVTRAKEQQEQRRASLRLRRASMAGSPGSPAMEGNDCCAVPPPVFACMQ